VHAPQTAAPLLLPPLLLLPAPLPLLLLELPPLPPLVLAPELLLAVSPDDVVPASSVAGPESSPKGQTVLACPALQAALTPTSTTQALSVLRAPSLITAFLFRETCPVSPHPGLLMAGHRSNGPAESVTWRV